MGVIQNLESMRVQGRWCRVQTLTLRLSGRRCGMGRLSPDAHTPRARADTHTHKHARTHARPQARPPRCCSHSPSARERISDTVLRMVGIAAAAAVGSPAGTLHLSRCRAVPSSRPDSAAWRSPRRRKRPRKVAATAAPGELCQQLRRGRLCEGRSSELGVRAGVWGGEGRGGNRQGAFPSSCGRAAREAGEGRG